jgi:hypothetical protein
MNLLRFVLAVLLVLLVVAVCSGPNASAQTSTTSGYVWRGHRGAVFQTIEIVDDHQQFSFTSKSRLEPNVWIKIRCSFRADAIDVYYPEATIWAVVRRGRPFTYVWPYSNTVSTSDWECTARRR